MKKEEDKKSSLTRRQFWATNIVAFGGVILSGLLFLRNNLLFIFPERKEKEFIKYLVGKVDEIPVGKAKEITIANKPVFITFKRFSDSAFSRRTGK